MSEQTAAVRGEGAVYHESGVLLDVLESAARIVEKHVRGGPSVIAHDLRRLHTWLLRERNKHVTYISTCSACWAEQNRRTPWPGEQPPDIKGNPADSEWMGTFVEAYVKLHESGWCSPESPVERSTQETPE